MNFIFYLCLLYVCGAATPYLFKYPEELKINPSDKDELKSAKTDLQSYLAKVNRRLSELNRKDGAKAIKLKNYLVSLQDFYLAIYNTPDFEESERLSVIFPLLINDLHQNLGKDISDAPEFLSDACHMFDNFVHASSKSSLDPTSYKNFFYKTLHGNKRIKTSLKPLEFDFLCGPDSPLDSTFWRYLFHYLTLTHLWIQPEKEIPDLIFKDQRILTFSETPLVKALTDYYLTLKPLSFQVLDEMKDHLSSLEFPNGDLISGPDVSWFETKILPKLEFIFLYEVGKQKWLSPQPGTPILKKSPIGDEIKSTSGSDPLEPPSDNKKKLIAACIIVGVVIFLFVGLSVWFLRSRKSKELSSVVL
jgi:hypothetical protein